MIKPFGLSSPKHECMKHIKRIRQVEEEEGGKEEEEEEEEEEMRGDDLGSMTRKSHYKFCLKTFWHFKNVNKLI